MVLPPGRKPLTDRDMVDLLHNMATAFSRNKLLDEDAINQTAARFEQLVEFEIESLDPAERSWYYDGDGTRRPKSQEDE
jgi:hypothetical protein